jgi:hypothetical protein
MCSSEARNPDIQIGTSTHSFSFSQHCRIKKFGSAFSCLPKKLPMFAGAAIAFCVHTAAAKPNLVQANYVTPQVSQSAVTVSYGSEQVAGDVNVVIVGRNDIGVRRLPDLTRHFGSAKAKKTDASPCLAIRPIRPAMAR